MNRGPTTAYGRLGDISWSTYGSHGQPTTPVLLLHSVTDSSEVFAPLLDPLAADRLVVTLDARGHGNTPLSPAPFTVGALASDVIAVLREVVRRPVVVVGHGLGALIAEEVALSEPSLLVALVLEDPAWRVEATTPDGVPAFLPSYLESFAGADEATLLERARAEHPNWPEDELLPWVHAKQRVDQKLAARAQKWYGRDWVGALGSIRVPVTVLAGEPRLGSLVEPEDLARAESLLGQQLTCVQVPGAGRSVRREARETYLTVLRSVLATADAVTQG